MVRTQLSDLTRAMVDRGGDLALYLVFDRPQRVAERPGLARTFFAQRCATDTQLTQMISAFRSIGSYVELFEGERPLLKALADGRIQRMDKQLKVIYNGIEGGITRDGFEPGRKALIPAVSDSYGVICSNSNAYGCALGRHKFHYFTVLRHLGVRVPRTWHYRPEYGWAGDQQPDPGLKVIVKSTYESWSVGVTEESIFIVDEACEDHVARIADEIGQPATVQEFIAGTEVCVSLIGCPEWVVPPPVETVLTKAPGDPNAVTTIDDNLLDRRILHRRFEAPPGVISELHRSAVQACSALELQSFARIDFRVDAQERAWVTDVGVSPGISTDDSAFHSVAELGFGYPSFLHLVIAATLASRTQLR